MSQFPPALHLKEDDVVKMLAAQVHLGTRNLDVSMAPYVWKRKESDGIHIINLGKTWEKLQLAARVIVAIENPKDIVVISARPYGQRAVLKFCTFIGATPISGRFTPGTFTNQVQTKFTEPRLLLVADPRLDHQPLREASYVNVPSIAFAHTDSPLNLVDIAIPCNNKGKHALGLMFWFLAREVLYLRGTLSRAQPWDVMVDLFFYREPDAAIKQEEKYVPVEGGAGQIGGAEEQTEFAQPAQGQQNLSNWQQEGSNDQTWTNESWNDQAGGGGGGGAPQSWDPAGQSWDH